MPHDLLDPSREATHDLSDPRSESDPQPRKPHRGDLYVIRRTAGVDVTWLVTETDGDRVRVVGVDDNPFAGSHDSARDVISDAFIARTDLDAWIPATDLEPALRIAVVPNAFLEDVDTRRAEIAAGRQSTLLEEAVDGEPDYRRWRGVLASARAALVGSPSEVHTSKVAAELVVDTEASWHATAQTTESDHRSSPMRQLLPRAVWSVRALAAALLLLLGLPLYLYSWSAIPQLRNVHQPEMTAPSPNPETRPSIVLHNVQFRKSKEVQHLKDALSDANEALSEARRENKQLVRRIAQLLDTGVVANVPIVVLTKSSTPTTQFPENTKSINLGASPRWTLSVDLNDPEPYPEYRLEIVRTARHGVREIDEIQITVMDTIADSMNPDPRAIDKGISPSSQRDQAALQRTTLGTIVRLDHLVKHGGRYLQLDLPTDPFEAGIYEVLLFGMWGGAANRLDESYSFTIQP